MNEQNPQQGGSYIRNPDGTLSRHENDAPVAAQSAEQPAADAASTGKEGK